MAQFVERMSKEIQQNEKEEKITTGNIVPATQKSIKQGVPVEDIVLDSIPTSSSETSPRDVDVPAHGDQEVSEITYNFTLESVPPQFQEGEDKHESREHEEEFSETITENIYPFSASTPASVSKMALSSSEKEVEVINNTPLVKEQDISQVETTPKSQKMAEKVVEKPKTKEKESFVLTFDDLQNVDFSGPKKKKPQIREKSLDLKKMESTPKREMVTSPVLVLDELKSKFTSVNEDENVLVTPLRETGNMSRVKDRCSELSFTPKSEGEVEHMLEEKSISMMHFPSMRTSPLPTRQSFDRPKEENKVEVISELKAVNEKVISESKPVEEIVISEPNQVVEESVSVDNGPSIEGDTSASDLPDALILQQDQMQQQLLMWQKQLEQNQQLLANLNIDDSSVQLQEQIQKQIQIQQQMMAQMQQNMEALRQQSQRKSLTSEDSVKTTVDHSDKKQSEVIIAESVKPVNTVIPAAPPAPQMNGKVPKDTIESPRANKSSKQKSKPSRKFEPKLDPREELMISIRNFGGRSALHKVCEYLYVDVVFLGIGCKRTVLPILTNTCV